MRKPFLVSLLSAAVLLAGCESVNTTSGDSVGVQRKQYMLTMVSTEQINQMYAQDYQKIITEASSKNMLDKSSADAKRVQAIADRLIAQAPKLRPDAAQWDWKVNLIKSDDLNANCGPGGKIIVFTGLVDKLKLTDDEIAAIMGHEIAHALREHGREQMTTAYGVEVLRTAATIAGVSEGMKQVGEGAVNLALTLPHSRSNEREADLLGLELSARAGYDPNAAITMWNKLMRASQGEPPEFLSTHPASSGRIALLEAAIPKVMPLYQAANK